MPKSRYFESFLLNPNIWLRTIRKDMANYQYATIIYCFANVTYFTNKAVKLRIIDLSDF